MPSPKIGPGDAWPKASGLRCRSALVAKVYGRTRGASRRGGRMTTHANGHSERDRRRQRHNRQGSAHNGASTPIAADPPSTRRSDCWRCR